MSLAPCMHGQRSASSCHTVCSPQPAANTRAAQELPVLYDMHHTIARGNCTRDTITTAQDDAGSVDILGKR